MTESSSAATAAQMIRIIEASIAFLLSASSGMSSS